MAIVFAITTEADVGIGDMVHHAKEVNVGTDTTNCDVNCLPILVEMLCFGHQHHRVLLRICFHCALVDISHALLAAIEVHHMVYITTNPIHVSSRTHRTQGHGAFRSAVLLLRIIALNFRRD